MQSTEAAGYDGGSSHAPKPMSVATAKRLYVQAIALGEVGYVDEDAFLRVAHNFLTAELQKLAIGDVRDVDSDAVGSAAFDSMLFDDEDVEEEGGLEVDTRVQGRASFQSAAAATLFCT
jgi:hypothetical protein